MRNRRARLTQARDALVDLHHWAGLLARSVDRLERACQNQPRWEEWYPVVLTNGGDGDELADPGAPDLSGVPDRCHLKSTLSDVINQTLRLRKAYTKARLATGTIADVMNSPTQDARSRWTTTCIDALRSVWTATVWGRPKNALPSALPLVYAGVPARLTETAQALVRMIDDIKAELLAMPERDDVQLERPSESEVEASISFLPPTAASPESLAAPVPQGDVAAVRKQLLALRARGIPYTSLRMLGKQLNCSANTVRKAMKGSPELAGWQKRTEDRPRSAPKAQSIHNCLRDRPSQSSNSSAAVDARIDLDTLLQQLKDQLSDTEVQALRNQPPEKAVAILEAMKPIHLDPNLRSVEADGAQSDRPRPRTFKRA